MSFMSFTYVSKDAIFQYSIRDLVFLLRTSPASSDNKQRSFPELLKGLKHKISNARSSVLPSFVLHRKHVCRDICFQFLQVYFVQPGNPTSSLVWCVFIRPIFLFDCVLRSTCLSRTYLFHTAVNGGIMKVKTHKLM